MYLIHNFCPRTNIDMGRHGFTIELSPVWPELVKQSGITQKSVNQLIATLGNDWLDACGYNRLAEAGTRLYEARSSIRITWGEWGPHHLEVPGNACGLDIDSNCSSPYHYLSRESRLLCSHNVDSWNQKNLLMIMFTELASDVALFSECGIVR
mgnify:CR=1 FL=1